jgi:hypothetical protein
VSFYAQMRIWRRGEIHLWPVAQFDVAPVHNFPQPSIAIVG